MAEETDQQDRTEAATPRRLQRAREEGHLPVSRELPVLAGLAGVALALSMAAPAAAERLLPRLGMFLGRLHTLDLSDGGALALRLAGLAVLGAAAPFVLAALLGGVAGVLLQTGVQANLAALRVDPGRISPLAGLRRLLGLDNLMDAVKSIAKIAATGLALWFTLAGDLRLLADAPRWDVRVLVGHIGAELLRVLFAVLAVQAVISGLDLFWVRLRHARSMRMSRHDIREETKETDGDPRVKARLRQLRMQRARRRMMAAVPKATVVITNPTHYAVALVYDRAKNAAPRVVAKGVDTMAARIREVAEANKVPLVANPPLARALHQVELDTDIPAEHYQAVAEIIAYVWRLNARVRGMVQ
jgi:flagellar biosynthetic protein FlhB